MRVARHVAILLLMVIFSAWLALIATATVAAHTDHQRLVANTTEPSRSDWITAGILMGLLAVIVATIVAVITAIVRFKRKRRLEERRERLRRKLAQLEYMLDALRPWADQYPQVDYHFYLPQELLRSARIYFVLSDLDTATQLFMQIQEYIDNLWTLVNTITKVDAIRVKRPDGSKVMISRLSHEPRTSESDSHRHYYAGGRIGKIDWPAGYYIEPFWEWFFLGTIVASPARKDQDTFTTVITEDNT